MQLTVSHPGMTENGKALTIGMTVEYRAHLPAGNIKIRYESGIEDVAHPRCFKELR